MWVGDNIMPEALKRVITVDDVKLLITVLTFLSALVIGWTNVQKELTDLKVRTEVFSAQAVRQTEATEQLTEAVQRSTITSVRLEERLKNLENLFENFSNRH